MGQDALETYLNDHLAGAALGCDHARELESMSSGTPFGQVMTRLAQEIEEDRETLVELMNELGVKRNPIKQATAWAAEKAGRIKFSGLSSGDAEQGRFLAIEALSLGVEGKRSLWVALERIADHYPPLQSDVLQRLIVRATAQRDALESERLVAAGKAFVD